MCCVLCRNGGILVSIRCHCIKGDTSVASVVLPQISFACLLVLL